MAELATAGSLVGLISLSIQTCQGLTSYYSAWKSYDEQISHTYRSLDELRITCENLDRELQKITQYQDPAVRQVGRLIASCQDGIDNLRHALDQCHSTQIPQTLTAKIESYRARALYPFKKQTLQTLKDIVHGIQGNLSSALQILQLHLSVGHEQRLASLAGTASSTETAVHNNQAAIQALSAPLQAINQAFPLIQQQTEDTALAVRAVHDEAHDSRQDSLDFRAKALMELTKLAERVDSSPSSLERTITMTLDRHSAGMNQLQHDLQFAHSKGTGEVAAKLEAIDQSIKGLQIGLISKPGLMRSVCEENDRLEKLSRPNNERRAGCLGSTDGRKKRRQRCSCKLRHNSTHIRSYPETSYLGMTSYSKWKFIFETQSMSHHPTCHLFASSPSTTVARFRMKRCGAFLAGALEASISITRGAGGLSISPNLRCARLVSRYNPAFELVDDLKRQCVRCWSEDMGELEASLDIAIHGLALLFRNGKASPYDVDLEGHTLLHEASRLLGSLRIGRQKEFELIVKFFTRLEELNVPLNWTDDLNLTFMNQFVIGFPSTASPCDFITSTARLLDTGAEFAKFSIGHHDGRTFPRTWMIRYCAEFADALEDNELSLAIWHQSERELDETLRELPHLINQTNGLGNTPLHLAVCWPYGVRKLLQHGSCVDAADQNGYSPLYYATSLGNSETLSLLMGADCCLEMGGLSKNLLDHAMRLARHDEFVILGVSQEVRMNVLDTAVALLAEKRRSLESRLAALPTAFKINSSVFQDDRILDEYTEYAEGAEEDALKVYGHMPRHASSLLPYCRTVYHCICMNVEIAEKLWQNGFRDIDVPDKNGLTPLMYSWASAWPGMLETLVNMITLSSWLIEKGAKLYRPQHGIFDYDPGRTPNPIELPPTTRALHYVAAQIGYSACSVAWQEYRGFIEEPLHDSLNRLSKDARLLPIKTILDVSCDDCVCACSSQGCLACTMMLKGLQFSVRRDYATREWFTLVTKYLLRFLGPHKLCPDWLVKEIIRYRTFEELKLRHTCFRWHPRHGVTKLEPEEQAEIRDEDHEKIELLEGLLLEFEENRGTQDVLSFLEGYWATRMDQVLQEQGCVDEEALRELGVVLRPDEGSDVDELHEDDTEESDSDE